MTSQLNNLMWKCVIIFFFKMTSGLFNNFFKKSLFYFFSVVTNKPVFVVIIHVKVFFSILIYFNRNEHCAQHIILFSQKNGNLLFVGKYFLKLSGLREKSKILVLAVFIRYKTGICVSCQKGEILIWLSYCE